MQGAEMVVIACCRGYTVHLQAEIDELLERVPQPEKRVIVRLEFRPPFLGRRPQLLGLGEFRLDLAPEIRERVEGGLPAAGALGKARDARVPRPLRALTRLLVDECDDGLPFPLVLPDGAVSTYA